MIRLKECKEDYLEIIIVAFSPIFTSSLYHLIMLVKLESRYDHLILDFGHLYLENERDVRGKNEKESVCTLADTGPSVNGWMNLDEKGCL